MAMKGKIVAGAKTVGKGVVLGLFAGVAAMGLKYVAPNVPIVGKYINEYL